MIFLIFILIAYISFLIVKPFISSILLAFVIAYIFYPVFRIINRKIQHKKAAAIITATIVVLLVSVPTIWIATQLSEEMFVTYLLAKQSISQVYYTSGACTDGGIICQSGQIISEFLANPKYKYFINAALDKIKVYGVDSASTFITTIPRIILNAFITIFIMYYLFKQGKGAVKRFIKILPFRRIQSETIMRQLGDAMDGVLYGSVVTAIIQGLAAALGYYLFDISSPLLWGLITGFFALIPFVGTPVVWLPAAILQILTGYIQNDNTLVGKGIGLIIYGTIIIHPIDNFLKPKLIGSKANIHPAIVLLGVLGGMLIFGPIGIIVGPLILALFTTFIKMYELENLRSH